LETPELVGLESKLEKVQNENVKTIKLKT